MRNKTYSSILFPDVAMDEESDMIITDSVNYLIDALRYITNQNHDNSEMIVAKIIMLFTDLRLFSER